MSRHDVQQRRAAGAARDGDAEAPVRVRTTTEQSRVRYALWARGAALVVVVLASVGGLLYASSKLRFVEDVLPRISDPGTFWAFNVAVASFAVVPGAASATSIAAGVIYGTPLGVALVSTSCATGAGVSFVIARYAARPIVEKFLIRDGSRFASLDHAVMRDGAQIVLLARLSPFSPYVAMSFLFGLTAVDFWPYLGASAVGILPASFVYVYMGDTGRRATGNGGGTSNVELAFYAFGLIATVVVTVRITQIAQETMRAKGIGLDGGSGAARGDGSEDDEDEDEDTDDAGRSSDEDVGLLGPETRGGLRGRADAEGTEGTDSGKGRGKGVGTSYSSAGGGFLSDIVGGLFPGRGAASTIRARGARGGSRGTPATDESDADEVELAERGGGGSAAAAASRGGGAGAAASVAESGASSSRGRGGYFLVSDPTMGAAPAASPERPPRAGGPSVRSGTVRCASLRRLFPRGRAFARGRPPPPRGVRPSRAGASSDVGPAADASSYRVLAFEDSYKIRAMLDDANVRYAHFEQRWTSENAVEALEAFGRVDVLMLDFYLPPVTGLEVLRQVNDAARAGRIERPKHILGMSSVMSCNARLVAEGADAGFVKWDVGTWSGWAK